MSWSRRARPARLALLGLLLALLGVLLAVPSGPAAADVPPLQLSLFDHQGEPLTGPVFVGDEVLAQSQVLDADRDTWTCVVDFGDGTPADGFWRARPGFPAPCAAFHQFTEAGTYTVTMTVTDDAGHSQSATGSFSVLPRSTTQIDGGVEGSPVMLPVPAETHRVVWTSYNAGCSLHRQRDGSAVVACSDQGTYTFTYGGRAGSVPTSGQYVVSYVNGPPRPTIERVRSRHGARVVGTGDDVEWIVRGNDPSYLAKFVLGGDNLVCRFDFGNGEVVTRAYNIQDKCQDDTTYDRAGTYTTTVTVDDGDGGVAAVSDQVTVVRRDVDVRVRGSQRDGLAGVVRASLTPVGTRGHLDLVLPDGRRLLGTVRDLGVFGPGQVSLDATGSLGGVPGYSVLVIVDASDATAATISAYRRLDDGDYQFVQASRSGFQARVHAPRVR